METDKTASAPPANWSGEKSNMGQAAPPPYDDISTAWNQQPFAGYPPQSSPGYPPQSSQGYPPQPQGYGAPPCQYQGPGYGQQMYPAQAEIVQPKHYVVPTPLANPVNDYLCYSAFTLLCCCMPLGIAALIYSISAREANHVGDQLAAERSSRIARTLNHVALGLGIGTIILIMVYAFVVSSLIDN